MQVKRTELVESVQIVADGGASRAGTAVVAGLADRARAWWVIGPVGW